MNMLEGANPFDVFFLDTINATGAELQENYYATMFGPKPATIKENVVRFPES